MPSTEARMFRAKIIGARLRQIRDQFRFSIKDAAEKIGVSSGVFSSYENGKKVISLPELELLAVHFSVPVKVFLGEESRQEPALQQLKPENLIALRQRMIGAALRARRIDLDRSLRDISRESGIPASRLSAYERGQKPIPLTELEVLAGCLDQSVEAYFDTHGPIAEELDLQEQTAAFLKLPEELRLFILEPKNLAHLRLAHNLSSLSLEELKMLGEGMVKLSR